MRERVEAASRGLGRADAHARGARRGERGEGHRFPRVNEVGRVRRRTEILTDACGASDSCARIRKLLWHSSMRREHLVAAAVVATVVLAATSLGSGGPSPFVDDGGAYSTDDRRMIVDDARDAPALDASEDGRRSIEAGADERTPLGAVARSRRRQLTDDELAILRDLEPEAFGAVPPAGGTWDRASKNPCFFVQAKVDERECLPYYHVVGAWQSGGRALNAKISTHPDVFQSGETHFWNEDRPMRAYLDRYDAFERASRDAKRALIVGDDSPGVLANTWTESQRLHRAFKDTVTTCWKACQALPETVPTGSPDGSPTERRRCVDGDAEDNVPGCGDKGNAADPPRRETRRSRAVRAAPDARRLRRQGRQDHRRAEEPVARLHAAYSHYEHYAERFGAGAAGFDEFVNLFVDAFEECASEHGVEDARTGSRRTTPSTRRCSTTPISS